MRLSRSGSSSTRSSSNRSSRFSDRRSIRSSYRSVSRSSHPSNRTSTRSRSQSSRRSSRSGTAFTRRSQSRSSRRSDRRSIRSSCRSVSRSSHSNRTSTRSRSRSSRRSNRSGTSFTRRSQSRSSRRSGRSSIRSSRRSDSPYCHHSNRVSIQSTRHRSGSHSTRHTGNGSSHCSSRNTSRSQSRRSNENAKLVSAKRFDNAVRSSPQGRKSDDLPAGRDGNNRQNVRGESGLWDTLTKSVNEMKELLVKIGRRTNENDRRLSRVEVTANKTLVLVGDLVNSYDARMSILHASKSREAKPPSGYRFPKLPIRTQDELSILRRDLKNKNFFSFLVNDQKQYCTPSQATDNVIMTGFLKRFISVSVRAELVLKDLKGKTGKTLFHDFREVYDFIIEVFKAGFEVRNKIRTNAEAQSVLRVVWGRSKQMLNEEISKKRRN